METYCLRISQEIAKRCDLERLVLAGRTDGRGPSALAIISFGIANAIQAPFRSRVDVVHLGDMAIWPLGYVELLFRRTDKLVVAAHGSDVTLTKRAGWRAKLYRAYLEFGARTVPRAGILANSSYIADLARTLGFKDVTVVPLGTDVAAPHSPAKDGILFAGRISRAKGLRFLVTDVFPLLSSAMRLRVAGPVWEESERGLLEHPQIEYLGTLSPTELAAEYSRAAITLIPSQVDEGFGLVAIEAAACGSQVIASNSGGLREAVRAPWGELVDLNDPAAWAGAIERRMSLGSNERERISRAAQSDVDLHFRWQTAADHTFSRYCR